MSLVGVYCTLCGAKTAFLVEKIFEHRALAFCDAACASTYVEELPTYTLADASSSTPLSETPMTDILAAIAPVLAWHYLTGIECDHTAKTDVSTCACALWRSEPQPSVGAAIDRWVEHVLAAIRSGNSQLREATGFLAQENRANQETISPSLAPLSTTSSEVQCSGCGIVAKQIAKPETLVGLQHYCGGTWRRSSLAPLSEPTSEGLND